MQTVKVVTRSELHVPGQNIPYRCARLLLIGRPHPHKLGLGLVPILIKRLVVGCIARGGARKVACWLPIPVNDVHGVPSAIARPRCAAQRLLLRQVKSAD